MNIAQLIVFLFLGTGLGVAAAEDHRHMHHFAQDVEAFHGVLAPVWHSPVGVARREKACARGEEMERLAKDIRSVDASRLVTSVAAMRAKCQGNPEGVERTLANVHDAFHHLIDHPGAGRARGR